MSTVDRLSTLEFTKQVGEYFKIGSDTKVKIIKYSVEDGRFEIKVTVINKKTQYPFISIGQNIHLPNSVTIDLMGYSTKTGRIEFRITAPLSVEIKRK